MNHHSQEVAQRGSQAVTAPSSIGQLAQGSMFWQPDYPQPSAWLEHLPALFWLVEAVQPSQCLTLGVHQGAAHFAVCQAVSRLRLDARCYGVQPHAELSDAAAADFQAVRDYHARHYSGVSRLMDVTPEAALEQFAPNSLDLVVFNLPAETSSIASLVELAVSRLSKRGVLVLPGIERREPGARLHRVFERLAEQYPAFAFVHGDGMGVVAVGEAPSQTLNSMLEAGETTGSRQVLRDVFQRLGRSCADAVESQQARQRAEQLAREVEQLEQAHERRAEELGGLRHQLSEQGKDHARQLGQKEARVEMLEEIRDELRIELRELLARDTAGDNDGTSAEAEQLQAAQQELQAAQQERDDAQGSLEARFSELAQLTRMLEEQRTQGEQAQAERDTAREECEAARQQLAQAQQERETAHAELKRLKAELEDANRARQLESQAQSQHEEELAALRGQLAEAKESLEQRFAELATLTEMLEEGEQATGAPGVPEVRASQIDEVNEVEEPEAPEGEALGAEGDEREDDLDEHHPEEAPDEDLRRLEQDIELLEQSKLFDAGWYLERYPDIAQHKRFSREPLAHYLMYGGFEGRDPGPDFDSHFYLQRYADVRDKGANPLVHYLRHGQQEQRRVRDE
uniref:class I SAM-dependent methyltransferase n=1 Tax=uncultured Halomonas sp. TaxID=173971 RepID=UPI002624CE77|nr:class I SAM-dependent methyltransferase [uncultured Halomonas sp.]